MNYGDGNELQKLEIAMEAAGMAWWWMELPTGAVFFSPNKTRMLDRKADDFIHYKNFTSIVHTDDYEKMMQEMRDHLEGRKPTYRAVYRIQAADGTWKRFLDMGKVVSRGKDGSIALAGMVLDVTDIAELT